MPHLVTQQLDSIHSMLSAGNRNLRIESHTLILWGLTGGILSLFSDNILTYKQFPDNTLHALAWLLLLLISFGGVAIIDWHLTRRAKQVRDETWSFIHKQVIKIFWLLISVGTLLTFATFFFGGGYMVFGVWIILTGMILFVHGLFSEEMLEWAGALMILIGVMTLGFQLPFETTKWIAASSFGIGCPLLALMLDKGRSLPSWKRLLQSTIWVVAVLALPLLAHRNVAFSAMAYMPEMPAMSLSSYLQLSDVSGLHLVTIPAGTEIPVKLEVVSDIFDNTSNPIFPLKTTTPIEVALRDGKLTGDTRFIGGTWLTAEKTMTIQIPWIKAELTPDNGAVLRSSLIVNVRDQPTP